MSDSVEAVSEVSSSSSSSSSHETHESHESSSTQSTSETSSSSSSSSTSSTEETHEINTSDSTSISHDASEADEADGSSSVNMSWINGDSEAYEQAAVDKANSLSGEITVDYAKQFDGQKTHDIDNADLSKLDKSIGYDLNCANFVSSVLEETGRMEGHDNSCVNLKADLISQGYESVSPENAEPGDVWIRINSEGHGHTEIVSGRDENGNLTFIGSNNIYGANGEDLHMQVVSERSKTDDKVSAGGTAVILHKDFTADELNNISEKLESNSIYDKSAEKAPIVPGEASGSASEQNAIETMSDISALTNELDKIEDIQNGNYSLSGYQSGNVTEQLKEKAAELDSTDNPIAESVKEATNEKVEEAEKEIGNPEAVKNNTSTEATSGVATDSKVSQVSDVEKYNELNAKSGQLAVDYAKSFLDETTCFINQDGNNLPGLDRQCTSDADPNYSNYKNNNCANFASAIEENTGRFEGHDNTVKGFREDLKEQGYQSIENLQDAQAGDLLVQVYTNSKGEECRHVQIVEGVNEDGTIRVIGSNNGGDHVQEVSEVDRTLQDIQSKNGEIYHKDFSPEEMGKMAEKLENSSINVDQEFISDLKEFSETHDANWTPEASAEATSTENVPNAEAAGEATSTSGVPAESIMVEAAEEAVKETEAIKESEAISGTETGKLRGDTPKEQIANYLQDQWGLSETAAAGVMGNIAHESGYQSNNLWNKVDQNFGGDQAYTDMVDNGTISREQFSTDSYPYGIVQFKSENYKEGLYDLAKERGTSVSDLETQLDYLTTQIDSDLINQLNSATTPQEAARIFESGFEKSGGSGMSDREKQALEAYIEILTY